MPTIAERLLQAQQHHQAGRLAEAEALYRAVLADVPQQPHALHLLGVLAHQQGWHEEARALIEQALAANGPHPVFHSNLSAVYLALDRLDEAEQHCRAALRLQPTLADAHANLAAVLERRGRQHQAASARLHAVYHQSQTLDSLTQLEQTIAQQPDDADAHHELAMALLVHGQTDRAIEQLRTAVRLRPDFALAHSNLASALATQERLDEAIASCRDALRLDPHNTAARTNLGGLLTFQGQSAEAVAELEQVLRARPDHGPALYMLSELAVGGHYRFTDDAVRHLEALAARDDLPPDDRAPLHFALALWLDRIGAYDAAFHHAAQGNALRQQLDRSRGAAFDPAVHACYVDRLIATFTSAYFERVRDFGLETDMPIFVVGMMRSGTTLVEQILASHPLVYGAGELVDLGLLASQLPRRLGVDADYPECVAQLDVVTARAVAVDYLHKLESRNRGAAHVVDKMPLNFLGLGLIATLLPQARIIHCRRDPIDTCLSCFFRNFAASFTFTYDLAQLGFYYRQYERLMAHWRAVLPVAVYELSYEALTAEPEAQTRRLLEHCGLPFDERCLRFHETARPVRTASMLQVRQPMYRSAVGRWRRYEQHLGPLLDALRG